MKKEVEDGDDDDDIPLVSNSRNFTYIVLEVIKCHYSVLTPFLISFNESRFLIMILQYVLQF